MEKSCSSYKSNENNFCDIAYSEEGKCTYIDSICTLIDCSSKSIEV